MAAANKVTTKEMFQAGEEHARAGKKCVPFDCQEIDKMLFAAMKSQERPGAWYAKMRGAFNRGWQAAYAQSVGLGER